MPQVITITDKQDSTLVAMAKSLASAMENGTRPFGRAIMTDTGQIIFQKLGSKLIRALVSVFDQWDYVGVAMPNPVPYRGVFLGTANHGMPSLVLISLTYTGNNMTDPGGITFTSTLGILDSSGVQIGTTVGTVSFVITTGATYQQWATFENWPLSSGSILAPAYGGVFSLGTSIRSGHPGLTTIGGACTPHDASNGAEWTVASGTVNSTHDAAANGYSITSLSPSYESLLAAERAAGTGGVFNLVVASNGQTLASEVQNTDQSTGAVSYATGSNTWSGDGYAEMFYWDNRGDFAYDHNLTFNVPEDCIYPVTPTPPPYPGVVYVPSSGPITISIISQTATPDGSFTVTYGVYEAGVLIDSWNGVGVGALYGITPYTASYSNLYNIIGGFTIGGYVTTVQGMVTSGTCTPGGGPLQYQSTVTPAPGYANAVAAVAAKYNATVLAANAATAGQTIQWNADWAAAQVVLKARRLAWFQKNSTATLAQLAAGVLPRGWDFWLRDSAPESANTCRPILPGVTYSDAVSAENIPNAVDPRFPPFPNYVYLATAITTTTRTVTYNYTPAPTMAQPNPPPVSGTFVGTEVATKKTYTGLKNGPYNLFSATCENWYVDSGEPFSGMRDAYNLYASGPGAQAPAYFALTPEPALPHPILQDMVAPTVPPDPNAYGLGLGLVWNGADGDYYSQGMNTTDSTFIPPYYSVADPFNGVLPPYSNTMAATVPDFVTQYRKDVKPVYKVGAGNPEWCDSTLIDEMIVTLTPFSVVKDGVVLGMFPDPDGAQGATTLEVYGSAQFSYSYATAALTFVVWAPLTDAEGNTVVSRQCQVANLPAYNCLVEYDGLAWPDTITASLKSRGDRANGNGDQAMAAILAALATPTA